MRYSLAAMATVILKRERAKPLWHGHPWVFSEAIARVEGQPADGDAVAVQDAEGHLVGHGFFSARSQIRVRLLAGDERAEPPGDELLRARLEAALRLRRDFLGLPSSDTDGYRLVHS